MEGFLSRRSADPRYASERAKVFVPETSALHVERPLASAKTEEHSHSDDDTKKKKKKRIYEKGEDAVRHPPRERLIAKAPSNPMRQHRTETARLARARGKSRILPTRTATGSRISWKRRRRRRRERRRTRRTRSERVS